MENRKYMKAVLESLSFTASQGIAQRGHRDGEESHNLGNFRELLHVIAKFDLTVDKKLAINPSNAKYTHHDIQNDIFAVMAELHLLAADDLAQSVLNALTENCTDTKWKEIRQQAETLCKHRHNTDFTQEKADPENSKHGGFYCGGPDRENTDREH
ncbi:hypothetical protein KUCAC02_024725 [Scomber scombrus]|uniref:DUF4371 domain-containing protein n=1 Tax=Scomber scombrus TaxID=13677 RepID=A0AAV1Q6C2_SCOSC